MANNNVNFMNECLSVNRMSFINTANMFLWRMTKQELDEIPTIKVTKQQMAVFEQFSTILSIDYPNTQGYIKIYFFGSDLVKLTT